MRIVVAGVGAVGGIVAWHLARAGLAPTLLARAPTARLLNAEGLTVTGPDGHETVRVTAVSEANAAGRCDVLLVGFKAQDWPEAAASLAPLIGPETIVVPMLNGIPWWYFDGSGGRLQGQRIAAVDATGAISRAVPAAQVLGCVVYTGGSRETPTHVHWNGRKRLVFGEPGGPTTQRLTDIVAVLAGTGLEAVATGDIRREIWNKLLGNITYNPLSVISGAKIGAFETDPALARVVRLVMDEAAAVAYAHGITPPFDLDKRQGVTPSMRSFKTSMLQDYEAGRPLELGAIVDAVVELGQLAGVPTPVIETVGLLAEQRWRSAYG